MSDLKRQIDKLWELKAKEENRLVQLFYHGASVALYDALDDYGHLCAEIRLATLRQVAKEMREREATSGPSGNDLPEEPAAGGPASA